MSVQYVVVVLASDAGAVAWGPFRSYAKADALFTQVAEADGGNGDYDVKLLALEKPTASEVASWVEAAGAWRGEDEA